MRRMMGFRVAAEYLVHNGGKLEDIMGPEGFDAEAFGQHRGSNPGSGAAGDRTAADARGRFGLDWARRRGRESLAGHMGGATSGDLMASNGSDGALALGASGGEREGGAGAYGGLVRGGGEQTVGAIAHTLGGSGEMRDGGPDAGRKQAAGRLSEGVAGARGGGGSTPREGDGQASRCPFASLWS